MATSEKKLPQVPDYAEPLDAQAKQEIERAVARFEAMRAERDRIKSEFDRALTIVTEAKNTITGLHKDIAELRERCANYRAERDETVIAHGKLQGLFASVLAQMRAFEIPITPIVRERIAADHESPKATPMPAMPPPSHKEMAALVQRLK